MNKKNIRFTIKISSSVLILGFVFYYIYSLIRVDFTVFPANVYARSFALAGSSDHPTKLCLISKQSGKLFGIHIVCEEKSSQIHLITQENIDPSSDYKIWVLYKTKIIKPEINTITTQPISEELPPLPYPAYGIVQNIGEGRIPQALVVLSAQTNEYHYPLATTSNFSGNYSFDLNGLEVISPNLSIDATYDGISWNQLVTIKDVVSPIPPIKVSTNVQ